MSTYSNTTGGGGSNYSNTTGYSINSGSPFPSTGYNSTSPNYGNSGYISPVTPRRERLDEETTPRKRSNSATEKETEKEPVQSQQQSSRSETNTRRREKKDVSKKDVSNPMKSFRVNLDDPCWKVLPAAMKKYDVKGREEDYRLYITYENTGITPSSLCFGISCNFGLPFQISFLSLPYTYLVFQIPPDYPPFISLIPHRRSVVFSVFLNSRS